MCGGRSPHLQLDGSPADAQRRLDHEGSTRMYDNRFARTRIALTDVAGCASAPSSISNTARRAARRNATGSTSASLLCAALVVALAATTATAQTSDYEAASVVRRISSQTEKRELTTNSSRLLPMDKPSPRAQVNNHELLTV